MDRKGMTARIAAAVLALLLVLGYFLLPYEGGNAEINNSGRKKEEIPTGEKLTWAWTPVMGSASQMILTLSGRKKAEGMTVFAEIQDARGKTVSSASRTISQEDDSDAVTLRGSFAGGQTYTLSLWAEGEGSIKVKGEEDEDGAFYPMIRESGNRYNPVLLYFAAGLLLLALTPVSGRKDERQLPRERGWKGRALPWAAFGLIFGLGVLISLSKPVYEPRNLWIFWDEELHFFALEATSPVTMGNVRNWLAGVITWAPGYFPLTLGYVLSSLITKNSEIIYRATMITSSLIYAAMAALAVKHAPKYKATFLVAGTMPVTLFAMTSYTYDTAVIGSILLGTALALESAESDRRVTPARAITMTALFAFGTVAKPAYSVALLSLLMIPAKNLGGKGKAWIFRGFAVLMTVWCLLAVLMPGAYDTVRNGDERFGDVSAAAQISWMLEKPAERLGIPALYVWDHQPHLMKTGISLTPNLGRFGELADLYVILLLVIAPLCSWDEKQDRRSPLSRGRRIGLAAIAFGAELILSYTQFIVTSPIGGALRGMQPRYFIPVWIAAALAVMAPQALRNRVDRRVGDLMTWIVFAACAGADTCFALTLLTAAGCL